MASFVAYTYQFAYCLKSLRHYSQSCIQMPKLYGKTSSKYLQIYLTALSKLPVYTG